MGVALFVPISRKVAVYNNAGGRLSSVLPMRFVSLISLVSVVSLRELVHNKGEYRSDVSHSRNGLVIMHKGKVIAFCAISCHEGNKVRKIASCLGTVSTR